MELGRRIALNEQPRRFGLRALSAMWHRLFLRRGLLNGYPN